MQGVFGIRSSECKERNRVVGVGRRRLAPGRFKFKPRSVTDHLIPVHRKLEEYIFQSLTPGFWIVWVRKNKGGILFAVPASAP
jgi:hypothetical protein